MEKILPNCKETEKALLGALLIDPMAIEKIILSIKASNFYDAKHKLIYQSAYNCYREGLTIDVESVSNELLKQNNLEKIGGRAYINDLAFGVITSAMAETHAKIIKEKAFLREIIKISGEITDLGYKNTSRKDIMSFMESQLYNLTVAAEQREGKSLADVLEERYCDILSSYEDVQNGITDLKNRYSTGISELDIVLKGGFKDSELILFPALSRTGKTAIMICLEQAILNKYDIPVITFQLEQDNEETADRHISNMTGINKHNLTYTKNLNQEILENIQKNIKKLEDKKYKLFDYPDFNVLEIETQAKRFFTKCGQKGIIFIDNLNLLSDVNKGKNEIETGSNITRDLKKLAKKLEVPVIVLCQLNKEAENQTSKNWKENKPTLGKIRGSQQIIANADKIIMIHRDLNNKDALQEVLLCGEKTRGSKSGDVLIKMDFSTNKIHTIPDTRSF